MPANGRWDLIRRLKVNIQLSSEQPTYLTEVDIVVDTFYAIFLNSCFLMIFPGGLKHVGIPSVVI